MAGMNRRELVKAGLAVSTAAMATRSAWGKLLATPERVMAAMMAAGMDSSASQLPAIAPRERLLLDFGWRFTFGHGTDPEKDLGFGYHQDDFAKTGEFKFSQPKFDDSKWRELDLPHDWAVELPYVDDDVLKSHGFKPLGRRYPETSVGWYRRKFTVPASDKGRRLNVEFDGAFRSALVFVNGFFVGRNDNGYAPFSFDISDFVNYGAENCITVRMDASFGDGWFYEGAGIYRHVWLTKTDAVHLRAWETVVRPAVDGDTATLELGTIVENESGSRLSVEIHWEILDPTGKSVLNAISTSRLPVPDSRIEFHVSPTPKISNAMLWSIENPQLYTAEVRVMADGKLVDAERVQFGIRDIKFDGAKGFFLNGKPVKIQGTCNHQDHAGVGAAVPDALQWYRLGVLKAMGSNAVRTSHNMPTPEWVAACDRMGMLMMCETRMMSSNHEGLAQLETMIKRYRNSPSVILWSLGNEEGRLQSSDAGERVTATMQARAHELDPTRLCTEADNGGFDIGVIKVIDVAGYNYNLNAPDKFHAAHPERPSVGTETASTLATRGIYVNDRDRNWLSAYDVNKPAWGQTAEEWWKFYAARDWLSGGFAWTGFDYRGEPTPYGWPSTSCQFGIVDTCGFPKDDYFYYKAWWGTEPVLHLFPHWNWAGREGEEINVWVHSNLEEVELLLNGKSLGSKKVEALTHLEWKVKYAPGVLEARGKKAGRVVMTEKRETTGEPAALRLTAEKLPGRDGVLADGEDLLLVRVEALDAAGRLVPTACNPVEYKVSGAGKIIGLGNGDPNCQEPDKPKGATARRSLFNGLAQVVLQAGREAGNITLEATATFYPGVAESLAVPKQTATARLTVQTNAAKARAAVPVG